MIFRNRSKNRRPVNTRRKLGSSIETLESRTLLAADAVMDWNNIALDAIRVDRTAPPRASRALAIIHASIYDAVNAIDRTHAMYKVDASASPTTSREAAVAGAAHKALNALFPAQTATFDAAFTAALANIPDGPDEDAGVALGEYVATAMLALRSADGSTTVVPYTPGTDPGDWQPTPPANAPALLPNWPGVTPWTMTAGNQFRPNGIPALTSQAYTDAFNEVKELGSLTSATRTADQTAIARFWANGGGTSTPPGHLNVMAQQAATVKGNTLSQNARLFAELNVAMADAAIVSWDAKYAENFWRPITGIRNADTDGNPDTAADATWTPLLVTPPFPAYTSGHSSFSGAGGAVLARFFGTDNVSFTLKSEDPAAADRSFTTFSQAAAESAVSRLYGGIHWNFDNNDGLTTGAQLGNFVADTYMQADPNQYSRWLNRMYQDALGRQGHGVETDGWLDRMNSGLTRDQAANQFLNSAEFRTRLIEGAYQQFLGRSVDASGLTYWSAKLAAGLAETEFVAAILSSTEYGGVTIQNADFVASLYADMLGRSAGTDEIAFWTDRLSRGASRHDVAMGFATSREFLGRLVDDPSGTLAFGGWYQHYLGRPAESSARNFWIDQLIASGRVEPVLQRLLTSNEYVGLVG